MIFLVIQEANSKMSKQATPLWCFGGSKTYHLHAWSPQQRGQLGNSQSRSDSAV